MCRIQSMGIIRIYKIIRQMIEQSRSIKEAEITSLILKPEQLDLRVSSI